MKDIKSKLCSFSMHDALYINHDGSDFKELCIHLLSPFAFLQKLTLRYEFTDQQFILDVVPGSTGRGGVKTGCV